MDIMDYLVHPDAVAVSAAVDIVAVRETKAPQDVQLWATRTSFMSISGCMWWGYPVPCTWYALYIATMWDMLLSP